MDQSTPPAATELDRIRDKPIVELKQFKRVFRNYQSILVHTTKPVWIVAYRDYESGAVKFWHAFKVKSYIKVPKGRNVWSLDNELIGPDKGFKCLRDAIAAVQVA